MVREILAPLDPLEGDKDSGMHTKHTTGGAGTHRWRGIGWLFAICLASGCASTMQSLYVESDPPGAFVVLNTQPAGFTPLSTQVPRNQDLVITLGKQGFSPKTLVLLTRGGRYGHTLPTDHVSVKLGDGRRAELYGSSRPLVGTGP
jgi:hypothetical protein